MFVYLMRILLAASAALLFLPTSTAQSAPDAVQQLSHLESVWNDAYVHADADAIAKLCADDLIVTMTDMQVLDKSTSIGIVRSGVVRFERYQTSEIRIRVYDNAAVVTGRLQRTRKKGDRMVDDEWRFTKVYIRREGKWQVVAWHASTAAL